MDGKNFFHHIDEKEKKIITENFLIKFNIKKCTTKT